MMMIVQLLYLAPSVKWSVNIGSQSRTFLPLLSFQFQFVDDENCKDYFDNDDCLSYIFSTDLGRIPNVLFLSHLSYDPLILMIPMMRL